MLRVSTLNPAFAGPCPSPSASHSSLKSLPAYHSQSCSTITNMNVRPNVQYNAETFFHPQQQEYQNNFGHPFNGRSGSMSSVATCSSLNSASTFGSSYFAATPTNGPSQARATASAPAPATNYTYHLDIVQQPLQARATGWGTKCDSRRPVDPPPVVYFEVHDVDGRIITHELKNTFLMHVSLYEVVEHDNQEKRILAPRRISGTTMVSVSHIRTPVPGKFYFLCHDISIRQEGRYQLEFSVWEIVSGRQQMVHRGLAISNTIMVYSAKSFPGLEQSSALIKEMASKGCKVRVRKESVIRKRKALADKGKSVYQSQVPRAVALAPNTQQQLQNGYHANRPRGNSVYLATPTFEDLMARPLPPPPIPPPLFNQYGQRVVNDQSQVQYYNKAGDVPFLRPNQDTSFNQRVTSCSTSDTNQSYLPTASLAMADNQSGGCEFGREPNGASSTRNTPLSHQRYSSEQIYNLGIGGVPAKMTTPNMYMQPASVYGGDKYVYAAAGGGGEAEGRNGFLNGGGADERFKQGSAMRGPMGQTSEPVEQPPPGYFYLNGCNGLNVNSGIMGYDATVFPGYTVSK